jgi:putative aldouronate transport system permease protein
MYGILMAFEKFSIRKGVLGSQWIGLHNFELLFAKTDFWNAFSNTVIISLCKLIFVFPVPIILAILLNEMFAGKFRNVLQTVYTFPHFLSWVLLAGIVTNIMGGTGAVNNLLGILGVPRQQFLANEGLFRPLIYISDIWKESGWSSIIYLAAIAGINVELYEAAKADGAGRFRRIQHVTWPGMRPTVVILFILAVGNVMNAGFDQIFNLYNPVVMRVGDILDTYIYRTTFQSVSDFGYTTAVGLFKSILNFMLLIMADRIVKLAGEEGIFVKSPARVSKSIDG